MPRRSISKTTYEELRERLLDRGHSFRSFALANGFKVPTVYDAARGTRDGKKTRSIARKLREFAYES